MSNTDLTKNPQWTHVIAKVRELLILIGQPPYYLYSQERKREGQYRNTTQNKKMTGKHGFLQLSGSKSDPLEWK